MAYFIYPPSGTISHTSPLEARVDVGTIPTTYFIEWRKNGARLAIGDVATVANLTINTRASTDPTNFTALDTGFFIDFFIWQTDPRIDPTAVLDGNSAPIILTNNIPLIYATLVTDSYGRCPTRPTIQWTYTDVDNDPQYQYQVKFGSTVGGTEYHDSTILYSTATSYTIPGLSTEIPHGTSFYWRLEVSDGEKLVPLDFVTVPIIRRTVAVASTGVVNTKPVVSNVLIDGVASGTIASLTPLITWTYTDADGQPQSNYRVRVSRDVGVTDILWDSGVLTGTDTNVRYNFQHDSTFDIESHKTLYATVISSDGIEYSNSVQISFKVEASPVITTTTVDGKVNPLNVAQQQPTFTWKYTDLDSDPLVSYEIRVGTTDTDLGTDSFIGDVWAPGVITSPESYSTKLNFDGTAFGGEMSCVFPKALVTGIRYYFQVMIFDNYGGVSTWYTGYFQLNAPPTASNLYIVPAAPWNSDSLDCVYTFVDEIGDRESDLTQIRWYRKPTGGSYALVTALMNSRSVPSDETIPGDLWYFTVRPHDGFEYSTIAYASAPVTIRNRPPVATALTIIPSQPKTNDNLEAVFAVSDPDGDPITVTINWYRNNEEQPELRNSKVIPASITSLDDVWYFTILPTDGYDNGPLATSSPITILNTAPQVISIQVDGQTLARAVATTNPTISWTYDDPDMQAQSKYEVIIGTKPARTKKTLTDITLERAIPANSALVGVALGCGGQNGVISIAKNDGELVDGNDIFDSGIVDSSDKSFQYLTVDSKKDVLLSAVSFETLTDYMLMPDLQTLNLQVGKTTGTAMAQFPGITSLYDLELTYIKEVGKTATYKLVVDGVVVDQFTSQSGSGRVTHTYNTIRLEHDSTVAVMGLADAGSKAGFYQIKCVAKTLVEVNAGDFALLSGYLKDGTGGIKLAGLAGTATTPFDLPSGTYDVELVYVTESAGSPIVTLSVGATSILSVTYETGPQTRSKFVRNVQINKGTTIKITGTRSGGALARVKKVIYRPIDTTKVGAKLKDGLVYYGSVRVYDGTDWSDWYTTMWRMKGSAWAAVSNRTGWTIETTLAVTPNMSSEEQAREKIAQNG